MPFEQIVTMDSSIFEKVNKRVTVWGGIKAQNIQRSGKVGVEKPQIASELNYQHQIYQNLKKIRKYH